MSKGVELITQERNRQIKEEGWDIQHDMEHAMDTLSNAAICYATSPQNRDKNFVEQNWPWDEEWWKPTPNDRIRELVKAGALIAAEIDGLVGRYLYDFDEYSPTLRELHVCNPSGLCPH